MDAATQIAFVLDTLVASLTAALPSVEVVDGQPTTQQLNNPDVLLVGFSPNRAAVEVTQERIDLRGNRSETLSVVCLASAWRGDPQSLSVARARAVEIAEDVRTALALDTTLGGAVRRSELGFDMTLDQVQTDDGPTATLEFTLMVVTL